MNKLQHKLDISAHELSAVLELLDTIHSFSEDSQSMLRVMHSQLQRSAQRIDDVLNSLEDDEGEL